MKLLLPALLTLFLAFSTYAQQTFKNEDIVVTNSLDNTELHGTLLTPVSEKAKAVLVLATGSGLQDRDETIGRHKPFKEIAEYLATNGYAVLRTDDRGYGIPIDTALVERSSQWDELSDYRCLMAEMKKKPILEV